MKTARKILLTIIHLSIFIVTVIMTLRGVIIGAAEGQLGENMINLGFFKAFTVDSNDIAGIASLILTIILIINLITKKVEIPYWAVLFHYVSAVSVALTFITTATFLAPTQAALGNGYFLYFSKDMFFLHFSTPVLSILTFIFGEDKFEFKIKENLLGLIPSFLYSIVYVTCAVILHTWTDFYGFTFGGHNAVVVPVLIIIYAVTFLMGFGIYKAHNKYISRG